MRLGFCASICTILTLQALKLAGFVYICSAFPQTLKPQPDMKPLSLAAWAAICMTSVLTSCHENFDKRLEREAREFTENRCPQEPEPGTRLDSTTYHPEQQDHAQDPCADQVDRPRFRRHPRSSLQQHQGALRQMRDPQRPQSQDLAYFCNYLDAEEFKKLSYHEFSYTTNYTIYNSYFTSNNFLSFLCFEKDQKILENKYQLLKKVQKE